MRDVADFMREHADDGVVADVFALGGFDQAVGDDDGAAGQRKRIRAHAAPELQRVFGLVAVIALERCGRLGEQRFELAAQLILPFLGQLAGLEHALVHLRHGFG